MRFMFGLKYWLLDRECSGMDEVADLLTIMRTEKKSVGDFFDRRG